MIQKYVRYGMPVEKKNLQELDAELDGIVVPAHLLSDQEASLPAFISELGRPFYIDPMSYAFATADYSLTNAKGDDLKRSWRKLAEAYFGAPDIVDFVANERLLPEILLSQDSRLLKTMVDAVAKQNELLEAQDQDVVRYLALAKETGVSLPVSSATASRVFTVSPYFFTTLQDDWWAVNVEAARLTAEKMGGKIAMVLALEPGTMKPGIGEILADIAEHVSDIILWVDGWDAASELPQELAAYISALDDFADFRVHEMFGAAFEAFLGSKGIESVSSGMTYGDRKTKRRAGGGVVPPRYYNPKTYGMMTRSDLEQYLTKFPIPCTCRICAPFDNKDAFLASVFPVELRAPSDFLRLHYVLALKKHHAEMEGENLESISELLKSRSDEISGALPQLLANQMTAHLKAWSQALDQSLVLPN